MENKKQEFEKKVAELKKKYGTIYQYDVAQDDGTIAQFLLRQPSRQVLSAATSTAGGDGMKYNEIILKNCVVDGDKDLLNDDSIFYGLSSKLDELISIKVGDLKKL